METVCAKADISGHRDGESKERAVMGLVECSRLSLPVLNSYDNFLLLMG